MKHFFIALFFFASYSIFSQTMPDSVIALINNNPVYTSEFIKIKNKNANVKTDDSISIKEYFDLFLNYKLKLNEALAQKLDKTDAFLEEFDKYTAKIADPFIFQKSIEESVVKEIYERLQWDIKVGHILVTVQKDAGSEDSLRAYEKALKIRERLINGEDFSKVAKATSDDPGVNYNSGILGYITTLFAPVEYENKMYALRPGQISQPVKTKYGYYIIKVFDKRKTKGEIQVRQIMVLTNDQVNSDQAKETIDSVYYKLNNGADFAEMSKTYSTEPSTKENSGFINWFDNTARFPQEFKDAAFSLQVGEYSKPFQTSYGWHIVKLEDNKAMSSYEKKKQALEAQISRDKSRAKLSEDKVFEKIKKEQQYAFYYENFKVFANKVNDSIFAGKWKAPKDSSYSLVLFKANMKKYTEQDFATWLLKEQKASAHKMDKNVYVFSLFEKYVEKVLVQEARRMLLKENAVYKEQIQDYYDGMLIFEISDKEVWSKANEDSVGLEKYFNANRNKYMWDDRTKVSIYICKDSIIAETFKKALAKNSKKGAPTSSLIMKINKKDSSNISITTKVYSKGDNEIIDSKDWKTGEVFWENTLTAFENLELIPEEQKQLNECRGIVISDYQKYLEKEWLNTLHKKYTIVVNDKVLDELEKNK